MSLQLENIPAGYVRHTHSSPLTTPWEPLYSRVENGAVILATRARQAHCNSKGIIHGGLLCALTDNAMGLSVVEHLRIKGIPRGPGGSTIGLAIDFLAPANVGQWLEFVPRVLHVGGSIGFVDCLVTADAQPIARGNGTYRFYRPPPTSTSVAD